KQRGGREPIRSSPGAPHAPTPRSRGALRAPNARQLVIRGTLSSAGLLLEEPLNGRPSVLDLDQMVGLFPEHFSIRRTNHQAMTLEPQFLDRLRGLRRGRVDILPMNLAAKFFVEPAHGGFDLGADGSTR